MKAEEMLRSAATEASRRTREFGERVSDTAKQCSTATDRFVHENPWATIAVAALIGCVVGFLLRSRGD